MTASGIHNFSFKVSTTRPLCKSGTSDFHTSRPALNGHKKHKRKGKRGKNKTIGKSANQLCNIYYTNVNGLRSKNESIRQLIQEKAIDILILTETKVYTESAMRLDGFQMFPVVRGKGGGLLIAVKHGICSSIMFDEDKNAEFATVKMEFGNICFRLLVVYGLQEGDHIDQINDFCENLSLQIEKASVEDDPTLMVGDCDAKFGKGIIHKR